jgi:XRE family transcriptional regulator, regulator of sulfur utilization
MSKQSISQIVGQNITKARKELGISQEKLADYSLIDRGYIGKIEKGTANPSIRVIYRIALILQVPLTYLVKYCWLIYFLSY